MTTTTDERALLRAVLAEPYEDTVRLVYADWCEENGDAPTARFIRHQIWTPVSPCRSAPLTALVPLEPLVGPLPHLYTRNVSGIGGATVTYPNGMEFWFRRGFVSEIHLTCAAFMQHAEAIFRAHPVTTAVLTDKRPWVGRYSATDSAPNLWGWWRLPERGEAPDILPRALMERLIADPRRDGPNPTAYRPDIDTGSVVFFHEQSALDALSGACVAYGRSLAQLPPLEVRA